MANRVFLTGHVGKDPDEKVFDQNSKCSFTLATSKRWKDKAGETKTQTEWHNCIIWGKLAGVAVKYVKKGSHLLIEGEINYRSYGDKEGVKKYMTEINVSNLEMLDKKQEGSVSTGIEEQKSEPGSDLPY